MAHLVEHYMNPQGRREAPPVAVEADLAARPAAHIGMADVRLDVDYAHRDRRGLRLVAGVGEDVRGQRQ